MLAHAFVTGGAESESERDIRVGGIGDVPASVFAGLTYAALGHLHGAQQVAPNARYAGSPLPFSFSERNHRKSVTLVDVDDDGAGVGRAARHPGHPPDGRAARPPRRPARQRPTARRPMPGCGSCSPTRHVPVAPMERLRERWPHTLVLDFQPDGEPVAAADDLARLRQQHDPVEICALFVEWVDSTLPDRRQRDALAAAVEAVRRPRRIG